MASQSTYGQQAPLGRRAIGLALALVANLLLILMLLSLAPFAPSGPPAGRSPVLIDLPPTAEPSPARTVDRRKAVTKPSPPKSAPEPPPPPAPVPPPMPWNIMMVSKDVFAASDISKLPQRRTEVAANAGAPAPGKGDTDDDGATQTGPNGERLYNAQWYVEPTDAELAYYLPRNVPQGAVAMIACRTVARFRVEDCVELGDSPRGLGLARAIVQAAWQFKVRPPSINGRPQIGEWVRIRIDFSKVRAP